MENNKLTNHRDDQVPPGMKVWVTPPGKETQPPDALAEEKENTEWVVEGGSYKY